MTDTSAIQQSEPLRNGDFTKVLSAFALFAAWLKEATQSEPNDPNAMAIATAGSDGFPDVRMVLLKGFDTNGFVFYTNTGKRQGRELKERPEAALLSTGNHFAVRSASAAMSRR